MTPYDKLLDAGYCPSFLDLTEYIQGDARDLWYDLTTFIEQNYQCTPKITYSKCTGKPGWNIKYQNSGKSLCTIYPEKISFTVLIVIGKDVIPQMETNLPLFGEYVSGLYKKCPLFNGTYWLMITITNQSVVEDVKRLLLYKVKPKI